MRIVVALAVGLLGAAVAAPAAALTVCLEESSPPYSYKFGPRQGGFDLGLAEALAARLGQPLKVLWFETEQDEDEVVPWQLNALLSDGRCDLLAGFALIASAMTDPAVAEYKLPDYAGMTKADRRRLVPLQPLDVTRPYIRAELAVVLAPGGADIRRLDDLKGRKVAAEVATLSGTILYAYKHGLLADTAFTVKPNTNLLPRLARGEFDAALIELHKAERYNARHPDAKVTVSSYRHPIGFNFGYAALRSSSALLERVNAALQALHDDGTLAKIAAAEGISYVPAKPPLVMRRLTPAMLIGG